MAEMDFSQCFDHNFSPTWILDSSLKVVYFNPMVSTLLQLPPRKIRDQKISDLLPIKEDFWKDLSQNAASQGVAISSEIDFDYNNARYSFVFRMTSENGHYYLFGNDLSVEKKLHTKYRQQVDLLKESHSQVVQADKVRAIGELTAGISHEINNPLTVASGNSEILGFCLENKNLEEERDTIKGCVENIDESLNRINQIIQGMKGFLHKDQQQKKQYIELKDALDNALKLTHANFSSQDIDLKIDYKIDHAVVLGDKTRLEQIFINLLQNAFDSLVSGNMDEDKNKTVHVILSKDKEGHNLQVSFIDNGPGVPEENQDKVFDTFFTTKEMGEGTGLGLSICHKIAEDHQGSLELVPSEEGAHFKLKLPVIEVSSYASNEEIFSKINDINGRKVLVVDNDATILNLCQKFLEETNYIFIGSTGGEEALDVLDKYDVDVVITDLNMPQLDGRGFVKKLREINGNIPVYYLSSESGMTTYQKDKDQLKLSGILIKPFKSEELLNLLKKTFSKEGQK